jgi:hypothetical protein
MSPICAGVVGVVAIHDDEDVVIAGIGDRVVDERAQPGAEPLIDHTVEDDERPELLPFPRDPQRRVGAGLGVRQRRTRLGAKEQHDNAAW